jgi:histidine ammonia-lyase
MMTACGAFVMSRAIGLLQIADIVASMSISALQGSHKPFDARVHNIRPFKGQGDVAKNLRTLLKDCEINRSHQDCLRVQDEYSLRCVPQVHGASRDAISYAIQAVETEMNSVTDNPLVFSDGQILSAGNFHGQPLALAFDFAAIALAELASISERRIYLLLDGKYGLPTLLMEDTGVNSGFMIAQYTAAALVSQNKVLCHPASVDSIPTSLGQEDHVSMGANGALKLMEVLDNVEQVLAIELLTSAQALDYRLPLNSGKGTSVAHKFLRSVIKHREADEFFRRDILTCVRMITDYSLVEAVCAEVGELI